MRSRGLIRVEHAIDVYGLSTSKQSQSINTKGKRYNRNGALRNGDNFSRFEVILTGTVNRYREMLKSLMPTVIEIDNFVKAHCKNMFDKMTITLMAAALGVGVGKSRQQNQIRLAKCIKNIILDNDLCFITDQSVIKKLVYSERQNII